MRLTRSRKLFADSAERVVPMSSHLVLDTAGGDDPLTRPDQWTP